MAKDGTNRGGRRVRAGSKPEPLADKIINGKDATILEIPDLEGEDINGAADMEGNDMPKPHDYLSAQQRDGKPLGADEIYKEMWLWLKDRGCEKLVTVRTKFDKSLDVYALEDFAWLGEEPVTAGELTDGNNYYRFMNLMDTYNQFRDDMWKFRTGRLSAVDEAATRTWHLDYGMSVLDAMRACGRTE